MTKTQEEIDFSAHHEREMEVARADNQYLKALCRSQGINPLVIINWEKRRKENPNLPQNYN